MSRIRHSFRFLLEILQRLWFLFWIGSFYGFLAVAWEECWRQFSEKSQAFPFSIAFIFTICVSWIGFLIADSRRDSQIEGVQNKRYVYLSFVFGSTISVFTLLGIYFLVSVAPLIH